MKYLQYILVGIAAFIAAAIIIRQIVNDCQYRKRARRINERINHILARNRIGAP